MRAIPSSAVRRSFSRLLCSALLLLALRGFAAAQATVQIIAKDDHGQPIASANVEIRSGEGKPLTATTAASGLATVTIPIAGKYELAVSKEGFVSTSTELEVAAGSAPQQVEVILTAASLSKQEIEVRATADSPVSEASAPPTDIPVTQAKAAPDKPATLSDTLPLVPGVVRAADGSVQIAGYGETHSALLVNSVNVTDPATGEFGLSIPIDAVDTIAVSEMPYLAQYGRFSAGVVAAETRRGGDKWDYSLNDPLPDFRIRSGHLQGIRDASPRMNVSGPVIKDKLYFLEGAEYLLYNRQVYTLPFPQNQTRSEAVNSFSQMDWIISPRQTLTASYHFAPQKLEYAGLNFFNPQPVTPDATFHPSTATLIDHLAIGGGILTSTFASTRVSNSITPHGLDPMSLSPVGNSGSYFSQENRRSTRYQWLETWRPRTLKWMGEHSLQLGSVVGHSENEGEFHPRPVLLNDAQGHLLERIDFTGVGSFDLSDTEPEIYGQDHWTVNSRFGLDLGLRLESQTITHTVRTAPRAGFVWSPAKSSNTVIRGGVGVFYDAVPLDIYAFASYPEQVVTTYDLAGNITDGPRKFLNVTDQMARKGFAFVHRSAINGNFAPYSIAGNIELEQTVSRALQLKFRYLQSRARDQITLQSTDVRRHGELILGSNGSARTRQFEFTARIGGKESRQFFFSYVRQQARGDINDASSYLGNFPFPVLRQNQFASLPSEIPNRFLLWGTYSLPWKMMISPKVEFRNGFPYQSTDVFQQYVANFGPQARFPRYFTADARLSKDIQVSAKHAVRISGSVFNLTNHFNPLEVHSNIADPQYGAFFGNYNRKFTVDFDFLY